MRFVSLGVAGALAAMLVLAGCGGTAGTPPTTDTTDYVTPLVGTWMSGSIATNISNPAGGMEQIPVTRTVTATIAKGTGSNMGTVVFTATTTVPEPVPEQPTIMVTGSIEVSASEVAVTITDIDPEDAVPEADRTTLMAAPHTLNYELMDDELKVSGVALTLLGATEFTLTKQTPS